MIEKKVDALSFQPLYISKDYSTCPLIPDVIAFVKGLKSIDNLTLSHRFGRRILINSKDTDLKKISKENFLELVDYDPFKKILLVIGAEDTRIDSPLHWYIHHARNDVNAVLLINDKKLDDAPSINNKYPIWTVEQIKEVLGALRDSKIVNIKNFGVLLVGNSLKEIDSHLKKYRGKLE